MSAASETTSRVLRAASAALAVAGIVLMVALTDGDARWIGLGWAAACLLVACAWVTLRGRAQRIALAAALLLVCVFLTFEGGLFMAPAVLVLLADALAGPRVAVNPAPKRT